MRRQENVTAERKLVEGGRNKKGTKRDKNQKEMKVQQRNLKCIRNVDACTHTSTEGTTVLPCPHRKQRKKGMNKKKKRKWKTNADRQDIPQRSVRRAKTKTNPKTKTKQKTPNNQRFNERNGSQCVARLKSEDPKRHRILGKLGEKH